MLTREDGEAWEAMRADLTVELAESEEFARALDELWPVLTPEEMLDLARDAGFTDVRHISGASLSEHYGLSGSAEEMLIARP